MSKDTDNLNLASNYLDEQIKLDVVKAIDNPTTIDGLSSDSGFEPTIDETEVESQIVNAEDLRNKELVASTKKAIKGIKDQLRDNYKGLWSVYLAFVIMISISIVAWLGALTAIAYDSNAGFIDYVFGFNKPFTSIDKINDTHVYASFVIILTLFILFVVLLTKINDSKFAKDRFEAAYKCGHVGKGNGAFWLIVFLIAFLYKMWQIYELTFGSQSGVDGIGIVNEVSGPYRSTFLITLTLSTSIYFIFFVLAINEIVYSKYLYKETRLVAKSALVMLEKKSQALANSRAKLVARKEELAKKAKAKADAKAAQTLTKEISIKKQTLLQPSPTVEFLSTDQQYTGQFAMPTSIEETQEQDTHVSDWTWQGNKPIEFTIALDDKDIVIKNQSHKAPSLEVFEVEGLKANKEKEAKAQDDLEEQSAMALAKSQFSEEEQKAFKQEKWSPSEVNRFAQYKAEQELKAIYKQEEWSPKAVDRVAQYKADKLLREQNKQEEWSPKEVNRAAKYKEELEALRANAKQEAWNGSEVNRAAKYKADKEMLEHIRRREEISRNRTSSANNIAKESPKVIEEVKVVAPIKEVVAPTPKPVIESLFDKNENKEFLSYRLAIILFRIFEEKQMLAKIKVNDHSKVLLQDTKITDIDVLYDTLNTLEIIEAKIIKMAAKYGIIINRNHLTKNAYKQLEIFNTKYLLTDFYES